MALKPCSSADGPDKGLRSNNLLDYGRCGHSCEGIGVVIKQREHLLLSQVLLRAPAQAIKFSSVMSDSLRSHGLHMPGFPVYQQLPEVTQTNVHWVDDAIQPSHPLSFPSPPAFNFPSIRVFSNESVLCIRWPKYWSFSFSISPFNEYSGLISFRMGWLDLFAVQGTL